MFGRELSYARANVDRGEEAEDIFSGFRKLSELRVISKVDNTKAFGKLTPLRHGSSAGIPLWLRQLGNALLEDKLRVRVLHGFNFNLAHRRFSSFDILQLARVGCYRIIPFFVGQWRKGG